MSAAEVNVNRLHFGQVYVWSLMSMGVAIVLASIYLLPYRELDASFGFLCLMVVARAR